jgi:hypothetical protein
VRFTPGHSWLYHRNRQLFCGDTKRKGAGKTMVEDSSSSNTIRQLQPGPGFDPSGLADHPHPRGVSAAAVHADPATCQHCMGMSRNQVGAAAAKTRTALLPSTPAAIVVQLLVPYFATRADSAASSCSQQQGSQQAAKQCSAPCRWFSQPAATPGMAVHGVSPFPLVVNAQTGWHGLRPIAPLCLSCLLRSVH